jgi:hypothetical protein
MRVMHEKDEDGEDKNKGVTIETPEPMNMDGGVKYSLKMLYYHTVYNTNKESDGSFAKLKWKSNKFKL